MALAYLIDYFLGVIDRDAQPGKYREVVSCLTHHFLVVNGRELISHQGPAVSG